MTKSKETSILFNGDFLEEDFHESVEMKQALRKQVLKKQLLRELKEISDADGSNF